MRHKKRFSTQLFLVGLLASLMLIPQENLAQSKTNFDKVIKSLASEIARKVPSTRKIIAVLDFSENDGRINKLGVHMAEELTTALADAGKDISVMDHFQLTTILDGMGVEGSKLGFDDVRKLGELYGIEVIVSGTILALPGKYKVNVKITDAANGMMITSTKAEFDKTSELGGMYIDKIDRKAAPVADVVTTPNRGTEGADVEDLKVLQEVEEDRFAYEVHACDLEDKTLTVVFSITNVGRERGFELMRMTRMFDNHGGVYQVRDYEIEDGNNKSKTSRILTPDVPHKITLVFENISPKANSASVIEVFYNNGESVKFRNITMSR